MLKTKEVVITKVPAGSRFTAGQRVKSLTGAELDQLEAKGHEFEDAELFDVKAQKVTAREGNIQRALDKAITDGALKPQDTAEHAKVKAKAAKMELVEDGMGVEYIQGLKIDAANRDVNTRITGSGEPAHRIELGRITASEASKGYIEAIRPGSRALMGGDWRQVFAHASEAGARLKKLMEVGGEDMRMADVIHGSTPGDGARVCSAMEAAVKAADYSDPNSQLGTLSTGLVLMRNLGFLRNILGFLKYITTDLRNEPAMFGQTVWTRYIVPPNVLTWVPGVGFTSDATTIAANTNTTTIGNTGTQTIQSGISTAATGTTTLSVPNTTDRNVLLGKFKATEISFPISTLASTVRSLFAEQRAAQLYSLAQAINQDFLVNLFQGTWNGTVNQFSLGNFGLPQMVALKNRMTLSQIPDIGRFAVLHSTFYDSLLADSNLLTAKAILALINKDASAFEQGDVPSLFGVKPIETQLASYNITNLNAAQPTPSATFVAPTISANGQVSFPGINAVGFAGNMSSMLFVARVPQDFTQVMTELGIPPSSSAEVVTDPDSGLTLMVFKFVNNQTMAINVRVCVMWGFGQGHPGIGIVLTP